MIHWYTASECIIKILWSHQGRHIKLCSFRWSHRRQWEAAWNLARGTRHAFPKFAHLWDRCLTSAVSIARYVDCRALMTSCTHHSFTNRFPAIGGWMMCLLSSSLGVGLYLWYIRSKRTASTCVSNLTLWSRACTYLIVDSPEKQRIVRRIVVIVSSAILHAPLKIQRRLWVT